LRKQKAITVLVTASGANIAVNRINCLKYNPEKRKIRIICTDVVDQPIMHYKADRFYLIPHGKSKKYLESLIKICKKEKVDVILPGSGSEAFTISKNIKLLNSQGIHSPVSSFDSLKKTMNKFEVFKILEKYDIPVPKFFLVKNKKEFLKALRFLNYPKKSVCFKPPNYRASGGGKGFRIIRNKNSINKIILQKKPESKEIDFDTGMKLLENKKTKLLVMEYLPGDDYSAYILAKNGVIIHVIPILVKRIEYGYASEAKIKKHKEITKICKKITKLFNFDYAINIQFRLSSEGEAKVIEINPRIAGAATLIAAAGVNIPYLIVKQALNEKLPKSKINYKTSMIRYWKELFVQNSKTFEYN